MKWEIFYAKARNPDGTPFYKKFTDEFLANALKTMGPYLFANQYMNEIVPEGDQIFRKEWVKHYVTLPTVYNTTIFIDPALSETANSDFTGITVVSVDKDMNWYVRLAQREKLNPTELVSRVFELHQTFNPHTIGIEEVAYQKVLLYNVHEEAKRRKIHVPVMGIKPETDKNKHTRIRSLVPRFQNGQILLNAGLSDLELELAQFPRGAHDDIIDSLAYHEKIVFYPTEIMPDDSIMPPPGSSEYESWYIRQLQKGRFQRD